ncbi:MULTISPECIES: hypothetical protein [unclassified Microcoleus]|uniref:hypothetical protein n=1 Tax=unclassified Microcoleus TaxID=2642155 RepID=UPI002FCFAFB3
MHYDRAIGSCTILLATFGYFHDRVHSQGDRRLVAIDFAVIGEPARNPFIEQISTQPQKIPLSREN